MDIVTSFPTVIFTFLLIVCVLWWLASMLLSGLDLDIDTDADVDGFADQLGLSSMPLPLALTILSLGGWVVTALLQGALSDDGVKRLAVGAAIGVLAVGLVVGLVAVKLASKPLGKVFHTEPAPTRLSTVGSFCKVRTLQVDERSGDAEVTNGPTRGSIIQVRAAAGQFHRGDLAHVIDYDADRNIFHIADVDPDVGPD